MRKFNIKELLNNRKTLYFTLGIILISVLSLTIVYAALSVTLNITGGDYLEENQHGWIYHWSMLAEQMTMYFLAAGSKDITNDDALKLFMGFERYTGGYKNE